MSNTKSFQIIDFVSGGNIMNIFQTINSKIESKVSSEEFKVLCYCCELSIINPFNCVWGHILSHAEGGETNTENMKPICNCCNSSMGKRHMEKYKSRLN